MFKLLSKLKEILFSITASQIVSGMLGAVVILLFMHITEPRLQPLATVDVTNIVNQFVKSQAKLNLPPQELQQRVTKFGQQLQMVLDNTSKKYHAVLIVQEAIVSGAHDLTPEVRAQLNKLQS